jgi:hypothetical protein
MTYQEILAQYTLGDIRPPRKGDLFLARKNHDPKGDSYNVLRATRNMSVVYCRILTPRVEAKSP